MKTSYFTFGQCHIHRIGGIVYDRNCVVKITAPDPRAEAWRLFGEKWSMEYDDQPPTEWFPGGVIEMNFLSHSTPRLGIVESTWATKPLG